MFHLHIMGSWAKTLILRFYHWMLCGEQNGTLLSLLWDRNCESTLRSQCYCALHTVIAIHTFTLSKWSGLSLTPKINHKIIPYGAMKCYSIILWGELISFTIVSQDITRHFFSLAYFSGLIFILFLFCLMRLHREKRKCWRLLLKSSRFYAIDTSKTGATLHLQIKCPLL